MIKHISGMVLVAFVGSAQVFSQVDSSKFVLKEVVVKENRMQIPFLKVSQNITLITKANIQATPARSLQEVLAFTPGIDVRQRGISGVQADIGIRGGSFEQTLILVNGIKLSDPQTGHHMMNIPVPLQAIERIDVLIGPGSRIFGQNAYAGAINIITALPEKKSIVVQGFGGDFGMLGGNVYAALPIRKYKQVVSASHDASKGYWHNSDFKVSNMYYESGFNLNKKTKYVPWWVTPCAILEPTVFTPTVFLINGKLPKHCLHRLVILIPTKICTSKPEVTGEKMMMNLD